MVLDQHGAIGGWLMGTERKGWEYWCHKRCSRMKQSGAMGLANAVWEGSVERPLPSRWPCLNAGSSVRREGYQLLEGCQPGLWNRSSVEWCGSWLLFYTHSHPCPVLGLGSRQQVYGLGVLKCHGCGASLCTCWHNSSTLTTSFLLELKNSYNLYWPLKINLELP